MSSFDKNQDRDQSPLSREKTKELLELVQNRAQEARRRGTVRAIVDELIVTLLLEAGLKACELCNINVEDAPASPENKELAIRGHGDTHPRTVQLNEDTQETILRFVQVHRQNALPGDPLLVSERGNRFAYASTYAKLKRLGRLCKIENLTPNRLRRTFIVNLFEQEQDLRLVQQHVGHANIKTTAQYLRISSPCQACGTATSVQERIRIDSGQILCKQCLADLRGDGHS
ncbi:tyrosine-type recombinase/integrase [Planctomycetota bacterium]